MDEDEEMDKLWEDTMEELMWLDNWPERNHGKESRVIGVLIWIGRDGTTGELYWEDWMEKDELRFDKDFKVAGRFSKWRYLLDI